MSVGAVGGASNPAIAYARQAPPILAHEATRQAAEITVFKMAVNSQEQLAMKLLDSVAQVGQLINTYG